MLKRKKKKNLITRSKMTAAEKTTNPIQINAKTVMPTRKLL